MEMERVEVICGLESSSQSRLWSTRGDRADIQEVAPFELAHDENAGIANSAGSPEGHFRIGSANSK